jgi:hypothetical protein
MMIRSKVAALLVSIGLFAAAVPASANVNDVQIDWMIAKDDWAGAVPENKGRDVGFKLRLLPRTLFVSEEDIVAADGTKLLPAGAQLYAMTGPNLAVCSQLAAKAPFVGSSKRVCLRDDDGDGALDSYWLRFPVQQLLGKGDWLILNGDVPPERARVVKSKLKSMPSNLAEIPAELFLRFSLKGNGSVQGYIWVKDGNSFYGPCFPTKAAENKISEQFCLVPDLIVRGINFDAKNKDERRMEVALPSRDVKVRFDITKGILMGMSVNSIYLN